VKAAQRGSWHAAAWILERRFDGWAKPLSRTRPSEDVPSEFDPFREVDEIARKRRERLGQ
jgi:hypothetical protein